MSQEEGRVSSEDLAEQVAGIAILADPIRRDLYRYVAAAASPVSRDQASDDLGIARHIAKFHLDKLAEEGLLDVEFKRLTERRGPGAGRPTKLYRRSARQLSLTLPQRRYDLAAHLLATAIDQASTDDRPIAEALNGAAAAWGHALGADIRIATGADPARDRLIVAICSALAEHGYEPQADGEVLVMSNCPFDTLARDHTELVCGMNLAVLTALTEELRSAELTAQLDPAPGRCCVVLTAG